MKNKSKLILPVCSAVMFIILIILIKTAGVEATGVGDTKIGLYALNSAAHRFFGTSAAWYKITEITGLIALAGGGIFALLGIIQLISRKSLLKVDKEILSLGGLYAATGALYVLFEKVIVNYRPVIMAGETAPEASFPSSHTVLVCVIMGSIFMIIGKYIKNKTAVYAVKALCSALAVITVTGRLISGVHWLTDIIGGIFLSVFLLSTFYAVIKE